MQESWLSKRSRVAYLLLLSFVPLAAGVAAWAVVDSLVGLVWMIDTDYRYWYAWDRGAA